MPNWKFKRTRSASGMPERDEPPSADLQGKVIIVTGGNSGIGFTTVQQLARRGARVYLAGRSKERVADAIARLHTEGLEPGNGEVRPLELDLEFPSKIAQYAKAFLEQEKRLDVLVHNAGRMRNPYELGEGGIEKSMLVNHVAPFMLTNALLPLMTETAREPGSDVRIVVVASSVIEYLKKNEVRFRDLKDFNIQYAPREDMLLRYAKSKLANILYVKHLQKTLDAQNIPITAIAVHPGYVFTEGLQRDPMQHIPVLGVIVALLFRATFLTSVQGARASVFAAAGKEVVDPDPEKRAAFKGAYVAHPGRIAVPPHPQAEDATLAKELWETTEVIVRQWESGQGAEESS